MDGAHDLGGKQGYGPVLREEDEPPFHEPWEGRVHGINLSSDVGPAFRYSIERMGAIEYLTTSYYEHWLSSMELNGVESGVFTRQELDEAAARIAGGEDVPQRFDPDAVAAARLRITPHDEPTFEAPPPRFAPGDSVTVARRVSARPLPVSRLSARRAGRHRVGPRAAPDPRHLRDGGRPRGPAGLVHGRVPLVRPVGRPR